MVARAPGPADNAAQPGMRSCCASRVPRHRAFLDGLGVLAFVALDRRLHQQGVDDLATARHVALLLELLLDLLEHQRARAGLRQAIAEQPNRLGIGDAAAFGQIQKLQETTAVQQLVFQRVVSQVVELLEHQNFDHQHGRIWRTAALGARWPRRGGVDAAGQRFEVHMLGQADQRITDLGAPILALMFGKQADPRLHHRGYPLVVVDAGILPSQANER